MHTLEKLYLKALKVAVKQKRSMFAHGNRLSPAEADHARTVALDLSGVDAQLAKKLEAHSMERYNGGIRVKRLHGSSTITKFLVRPKGSAFVDGPNVVMVEGYGATPGERKTYALKSAARTLWKRGVLR